MGLKAVLSEDEFGELEDATKGLYAESEGGKYVLDVDGVDDLPQVASLRNGHRNSKRERDEAKRQLEAFRKKFGPLADIEDLDLSDADEERFAAVLPYLRGEAELPAGEGNGKSGGEKVDLDKIKLNARKPLERELQTIASERDELKTRLERIVTDSALTSAIAEIKVNGPFTKAVKAMFRDKVKVIEGDDGQPVAVIEGEYGEQPVDKYLKEWALTDEGKEFIQAPGNNGGGSRGGSGSGRIKNPWAKDNWSPAEQARIYKEQGADVARRMAAEHGKKVL